MAKPQFNQRQKDIARLVREQRSLKGALIQIKNPFRLQFSSSKKGGS